MTQNITFSKEKLELLSIQGIYIGKNKKVDGKTAMLFPGHGAQYPNMLKELYHKYPIVKEVFDRADVEYQKLTKTKLTTAIFSTGDDDLSRVKTEMAKAEVMQPSIYTANMAMYHLLRSMGNDGDLYIGHSLGEISALAAAGAYTLEEGLWITYHRAWALNKIEESKRGTMISIKLSRADELLESVMNSAKGYCTVALHNSPDQVVVSGEKEAIERIDSYCGQNNIASKILPVSHGYHSELLTPAVTIFAEKLKTISWNAPTKKVVSTINAKVYDEQTILSESMPEFLASQLITPFSFYEIIQDLYENEGITNFIEVGPKNILTKLVKDILPDKSIYAIASNTPKIGDEHSLRRLNAYLEINNLKNNKQEEENSMLNTKTISADVAEDYSDIEDGLIDILKKITGYPKGLIKIDSTPLRVSMAMNKHVFRKTIEIIGDEYGISNKLDANDESISLDLIFAIITGQKYEAKPTSSLPLAEEVNTSAPVNTDSKEIGSTNIDSGVQRTEVEQKVKEIFEIKTGYPVAMLDSTLDLEADLGIDSVKQADVLGMIREHFGYELDPNVDIKEFNTIDKITKYTLGRIGAPSTSIDTETDKTAIEVNREEVGQKVKEIFEIKTGYPIEMLDSTLDLEADLGIDSVKQADVLGMIREHFGYELDPNVDIKEFNTIDKITEYTVGRIGGSSTSINKEAEGTVSEVSREEVGQKVKEIFEVKTGYPIEMLDSTLDLEADLGIDSVKQADVLGMVREHFGYELDPNVDIKEFNTIDKIIEYTLGRIGGSFVPTNEAAEIEVSKNEVEQKVKEIFEVKTGYPIAMLDSTLDLEADLGIDSVKQADVLGMIREHFGYELDPNVDIKEFNTIDKIIDYTLRRVNTSQVKNTEDNRELKEKLIQEQINNFCTEEKALRHIPVTIEKPYNKEQGEEFELRNKNFVIVEDRLGGDITQNVTRFIEEQGGAVVILTDKSTMKSASKTKEVDFYNSSALEMAFVEIRASFQEVHGFINLYPLIDKFSLEEVDYSNWQKEVDASYNIMFYGGRTIYNDLEKNGSKAACYAATNIGGIFGLEEGTSLNPIGGITSGFLKSLQKEIPELTAKVVDYSNLDVSFISETLKKEIVLREKLVEIGYSKNRRKTICIRPKTINIEKRKQPFVLNDNDIILVTGGGRGINYEFVKGLSEVYNPTIITTGRTEFPSGNEEWIKMSDEEFQQYEKQFFTQSLNDSPRPTPIQIKNKYQKLKAARELYYNIQVARENGMKLHYLPCDVAADDSVKAMAEKVEKEFGKVTGIVNGAGLSSFGKLPKKSDKDSLKVVQVKANGFYSLYHAFKNSPLKFFMNIGSISGRFGMDGQVDYVAGADIIARMAFQLFRHKPEIQFYVMGWTAWSEVGMAANPEVEKVQKEQRGLEYLKVGDGVKKFLMEVSYGGEYPEVLIFSKIGKNKPLGQFDLLDETEQHFTLKWDENGVIHDRVKYPLLQKIESYTEGKEIYLSKELNADEDIYLRDHLVEGKCVYAGVMHLEAFSQIVSLVDEMTRKENSSELIRMHDIDFSRFVKYFSGNPLKLRFNAEIRSNTSTETEVYVEVKSDFCNKQGIVLQKDLLHSTGSVTRGGNFTRPEASVNYAEAKKRAQKLDIEKFYDLTNKYITFDSTFRNLTYVGMINENEFIGEVIITDDSRIFSYSGLVDTLLSPITIDNAGRLCLFNDFQNTGHIVVPRNIKESVLYRPFKKNESAFLYCKKLDDNGETIDCFLQILDSNNQVIFEIKRMALVRINKYNGDHNIVAQD